MHTPQSTDKGSVFSRLMDLAARLHGAVVNLHDVTDVTLQVPDLRLKPEQCVHHGGFCRFAKFIDYNRACAINKQQSIRRARRTGRAFWGCCPFGVWDLAHPLVHEGRLLAVLYVGHFRTDRPLSPVNGRVYEGPEIPLLPEHGEKELKNTALLLADNFHMILEEWLGRNGPLGLDRGDSYYRHATLRFLEACYTENINLQDLARELGLHPHYLGKVVSRVFGESFSSLLRKRRIEEAKLLLRAGKKPVTRIALECGFQDSNYFSTVFRGLEGVSPSDYRRRDPVTRQDTPPGTRRGG